MPEETAAYTANGEPKYPFTGRIVEAYYTNNELSEIMSKMWRGRPPG